MDPAGAMAETVGLPAAAGPGLAPGGLVAVLVVDGQVVDFVPLVDEVTDVAGVAVRHAGATLAAADIGQAAAVGIYDGDTGALVMVRRVLMAP
jgi:hypothetical protein